MKFITIIFFLVSIGVRAQTGSEIYLADLKITKAGLAISNPKNITNRLGYDNQPFFHPDKPVIYFASFNEEGRSDIKTFNYKTQETKLFTQTPEREYSPTVSLDPNFISCILQRDNGAQDLVKYPKDGSEPFIINKNLTIGYHAWLRPTDVLVFVLGEPNTLHHLDLMNDKDTIVAQQIGRSLHKVPNQPEISFVDKSTDKWLIKLYDDVGIRAIGETLTGREDLAWTPDGKIIMSDGRQFFYYDTRAKDDWTMFFASALDGITRIAVSPDGKKIAFVVAEK